MANPPTRRKLRERFERGDTILAPFVYDGLQAKLAEAAGFEAVYMTGFGTAAARGLPDLGLLTMTDMVQNVASLAASVSVPLICDADTGYGGPLNAARTVREYERAGAAALHIEDQVWPKRCGFLAGKQVIPLDEMVAKVRAACDARSDGDLLLIARTDALAPLGWDEAERRARAYRAAGADCLFVDGIRRPEELDEYVRRLGDLPLLYNGHLRPPAEIAALGFRIQIHPGTLAVAFRAVRDAMATLRATGTLEGENDPRVFADLLALLGVPEALRSDVAASDAAGAG